MSVPAELKAQPSFDGAVAPLTRHPADQEEPRLPVSTEEGVVSIPSPPRPYLAPESSSCMSVIVDDRTEKLDETRISTAIAYAGLP